MNIIFEALIVGAYSIINYVIISNILYFNKYTLLFIIGFIKHLIGYYSGLHSYYCVNGKTCTQVNNKYKSAYITNYELVIESLFEGLLFLIFGSILLYLKINIIIIYFLLGFILHLLFEQLSIHSHFCKKRCKK
jgi:hypothetical protein